MADPEPDDPFELRRFLDAQGSVWNNVVAELSAGDKRSHWMWFVFPQLHGLGTSAMARRYAISGLVEARAYLDHRTLGPRLRACSAQLLEHRARSARDILGSPDDVKLRSSMTLFERAAPGVAVFADVLEAFCDGQRDMRTVATLR